MATKMTEAQVSTDKRHQEDSELDESQRAGKKEEAPRLPHEHDESFDSQEDEPRDVIKRAFDDIDEGQMDTDRRGIPGVEEVERGKPGHAQQDIPESSRMPPSVPKK